MVLTITLRLTARNPQAGFAGKKNPGWPLGAQPPRKTAGEGLLLYLSAIGQRFPCPHETPTTSH